MDTKTGELLAPGLGCKRSPKIIGRAHRSLTGRDGVELRRVLLGEAWLQRQRGALAEEVRVTRVKRSCDVANWALSLVSCGSPFGFGFACDVGS